MAGLIVWMMSTLARQSQRSTLVEDQEFGSTGDGCIDMEMDELEVLDQHVASVPKSSGLARILTLKSFGDSHEKGPQNLLYRHVTNLISALPWTLQMAIPSKPYSSPNPKQHYNLIGSLPNPNPSPSPKLISIVLHISLCCSTLIASKPCGKPSIPGQISAASKAMASPAQRAKAEEEMNKALKRMGYPVEEVEADPFGQINKIRGVLRKRLTKLSDLSEILDPFLKSEKHASSAERTLSCNAEFKVYRKVPAYSTLLAFDQLLFLFWRCGSLHFTCMSVVRSQRPQIA